LLIYKYERITSHFLGNATIPFPRAQRQHAFNSFNNAKRRILTEEREEQDSNYKKVETESSGVRVGACVI